MSEITTYNPDNIKEDEISSIFITDKEVNFINSVASEVLQKTMAQSVFYIKIDKERTQSNFYGESKEKITMDKIKLPARVTNIVRPINDEYGIRYEKETRIAFLQKLNIAYGVNDIEYGNFIEWQQKLYEIINIDRKRILYGQEQFGDFEIICICKARQ